MSYLRYFGLFAYSGIQCFFSSFCVPCAASFSWLSIFVGPFGIL